jgi:hypothetical protein
MPNWCLNKLTIEHEDGAMVDRFVNAYNSSNTCNEFLPMPKGIGDGWYEWCINHWGTKWDIGCDNDERHGLKPTRAGNQVTVSFDSAWAPPVGLYQELVLQGFRVVASYFEPGMGFCGEWIDGNDDYIEYGDDKTLIPKQVYEDYNLEDFFSDDEVEA